VGNITSSENSDYAENFYKNGLLESLTIGWKSFGAHTEIDKETCWVLSNIVGSNSVYMTKAILNNPFFTDKIRDILTLSENDPTAQVCAPPNNQARRELLFMLKNISSGYQMEILYTLVFKNNIFMQLIPYLDPLTCFI
jgi:hypothetical protein